MDAIKLGIAMREARDVDALCNVVTGLVSQLGFHEFMFTTSSETVLEHLTPTGAKFFARYRERRLARLDPVLRKVLVSRYPIHWDAETYLDHSPNEEHQAFWEAARAAGFVSGLSVPIHGPGEHLSTFVCISHERRWGDAAILQRVADDALVLATMLSVVYHDAFESPADTVPHLTDRETQCMLWTARGKTAPEVAHILGITARTVNFHIQNVMGKLGTASKYQAALEVNRRGLFASLDH